MKGWIGEVAYDGSGRRRNRRLRAVASKIRMSVETRGSIEQDVNWFRLGTNWAMERSW